MNKKIYVILFLVIILSIGGYYYLYYQSPVTQNEQNEASQSNQNNSDELPENNKCSKLVNKIIDGTFQKVENNLFYFQVKDNDFIESVKLTSDTLFLRMNFSSTMEIINQLNITLTELTEGDLISVVVLCEECDNEEECAKEKIALIVRQMNVEVE